MIGRRIFAAIDIPDAATRQVIAFVGKLRRDFKHLRVGWESPDKLHITVKFAGYLDDDNLKSFITIAESAAQGTVPFDVTIKGTGSFIKRKGPNVLWLGLDAAPIAKLSALFDNTVKNEKDRPILSYNPHLTIARLREPQASRELIDRHMSSPFEPISFRADELVVYESYLLPTGSVYRALSKHPFRGSMA